MVRTHHAVDESTLQFECRMTFLLAKQRLCKALATLTKVATRSELLYAYRSTMATYEERNGSVERSYLVISEENEIMREARCESCYL